MAYEQEARDFAEEMAIRISFSENAPLHSKQLVRGFKRVTDTIRASAMAWFYSRKTVNDPKADKLTYSGLYRVANVSYDEQNGLYIETLRLGWASSVLSGSLPNDECMVQQGVDQRSDARLWTLIWRNISDVDYKACVDSIRAAGSFVNPTIQGTAHSGTTLVVGDITTQQADDGSYTITVGCLRVTSVTAAADLDSISPLRQDVLDIENPFGIEGGFTSGNTGRRPRKGIILTYRAISTGSRTVLLAITDAEWMTRLDTLLGTAAGYKLAKREIDDDSGNALKVTVAYEHVALTGTINGEGLNTSTPEADARYVGMTRHNQSGKLVLTRSWPRIDPAVADTLLSSNVNTKVTANEVETPMADGKTYSGTWLAKTTKADNTNRDGVDIIQELTQAGDASVDVITGADTLNKTYEFYRYDASKAAVDAFLANSDPLGTGEIDPKWETPEDGITKLVKISNNADASLNLYAIYSVKQAWSSAPAVVVEDDGVRQKLLSIYRNQTAIPVAALSEKVDAKENGAGGFDAVKIKQQLIDGENVKTSTQSSVAEWDIDKYNEKVPFYDISTVPDESHVAGYNLYTIIVGRYRIVTVTVTKTYSLTEPSAGSVTPATGGAGLGEGTSRVKQTVQIGDIWCTEERTAETGPYSAPISDTLLILSARATPTGE